MARPISVKDARYIAERHKRIIDVLCTARPSIVEYQKKIKALSDSMVTKQLMNVLADIPIEEISRGRKGLRIKALRDYGYNSIADIASA